MKQLLTTKQFAKMMGVHYRTALSWLDQGLVPGARWRQTAIAAYWEIPERALGMERPKTGPKPTNKRKAKN